MSNIKNTKILIPLPSYGFDPSEAAIPWLFFSKKGFDVIFATPKGEKADADSIMLTGKGLGIFKKLLMAKKDALSAYKQMYNNHNFISPIAYSDIEPDNFEAVFLPGGHHKGVIEYLESDILHSVIPYFFNSNKIIGAICHGPLLLAKTINPLTNKSVIYDYKTTSLLKSQELLAYYLTKYQLKDYYLTYPETTVEDEVISNLKDKKQYVKGNFPIFRDTINNPKKGFSVTDRNYISARWPGDVYNISYEFTKMITNNIKQIK